MRSISLQAASWNSQAILPASTAGRADRITRAFIDFAAFTMSMHVLRLGPVNLTLSDAALACCLIILVSRQTINHTPFGQATFFWCAGLSLMLGGLLVSSIINGDPLRWIVIAGQYLFAWLLLPMVFFSLSSRQMQRCLLLFVYGVSASQAFAIAASTYLSPGTLTRLFGPGFFAGNGRVGALTGESNWNGAVIAFALPMLINCLHHKLIGKFRASVCAIFLLWGLLACASFTGFGAAILAVVIALGLSSPRRLFALAIPLVGVVAGYMVSGLPLPGVFQQRVAGALTSGDLSHAGTFEGRSMLIAEAWRLSEHTILLGFGADRYREVSSFGAPVHQFLLLILTEGGAVALAGLLIMLVVLWILAARAVVADRHGGAMVVAVLAVFCIYTTAVPHMYTRLWIGPVLMALAAVARRPSSWLSEYPNIQRPRGKAA